MVEPLCVYIYVGDYSMIVGYTGFLTFFTLKNLFGWFDFTFPRITNLFVIEQIIYDMNDIIEDYIDDHKLRLGDLFIKRYENYQERLKKELNFKKNLVVEIECLLLNMKSVVIQEEKKRNLSLRAKDSVES